VVVYDQGEIFNSVKKTASSWTRLHDYASSPHSAGHFLRILLFYW